jgi:hypothetical protein
MKRSILFSLIPLGLGIVLLGPVPNNTGRGNADGSGAWTTSAARRHRHAPAIIKERHGRNATSTNWSGYAVTGPNGSVTDVKGSWIVPAVKCTAGAPDSYSSYWVGIDGYGSNTVEQIGIDADCVSGKPAYSAWYEYYPHWPYIINNFPVASGNIISAEVSYGAKGQFTVSLTNQSVLDKQRHPITFSNTTKMPQAQSASAEWIVEAPWSSSVLPLANFTSASFGHFYTGQPNTCYATVSGKTGPIGSFNTSVIQINMVSSTGAMKALTLPLSPDGSSFTDVWQSPGP